MRKKVFGRQFSRAKKSREALFRSLIKAVIARGSIVTTEAKAKSVSGQIDKLLTFAKVGSLSARRKVLSYLGNDRETTNFLFAQVAPVFAGRKSGFTRITLLTPRRGDAAHMARIEWVEKIEIGSVSSKSSKGKDSEKKSETLKIQKNSEALKKSVKSVKK